MAETHLRVANLDEAAVERIQSLEQELNAHILALEPQVTLRNLDEEAMGKLRALEESLGVVLVAYDPV